MTPKSLNQQEAEWIESVKQLGQIPGIILDIGGGSPFQGPLKQIDIATNTLYVCVDIRQSSKPTIIGDIMRLPFASNTVAGILNNAVLEHVPNPTQSITEIYRVLKPKASAYIGVPFVYPYHDQVDYFRFSDDALRYLLRNFSTLSLSPLGNYAYVVLMFLTGFQFRLVKQLHWIVILIDKILAFLLFRFSDKGRDYYKSLSRTVIGWYVKATK